MLFLSTSQATYAYDATVGFNPGTYASNPNGVWSYGYTTTLGGSFIPHLDSGNFAGIFQYWRTDIGSGTPAFEKNIGVSPMFGVQPGQIALHGGPNGELGVLRFTAPSAGSYNIATSYFVGDSGDTDIYLLHNGSVVSSAPSTNAGGSFSLASFLLNANDTLDVAVGIGTDTYFGDTTPISHVITSSAPEPGTLGLLALGMLSGIAARRKGKLS
nr:PEP-CTERM sorting domain-containing protein [Armatimonas sp.]